MSAYDRLLEYRIKPSVQRIAIMDYLMSHHTHPTADEIYLALSPSMPTLSKTTVYNTLRLFAEQGAALMLTIDDRNANFDGKTEAHAHFFCKRCGRIYDVACSQWVGEAEKAAELDGCSVSEVHYYYKGICKNCLEKQ